MKILHTSDWHIGQNFYNYTRDDEHREVLAQIAAVMADERPDALLVCGDVFHNPAPGAAAVKLFTEAVIDLHYASPGTKIIITAGNHDSSSRLEANRRLWSELDVSIVGAPRRESDGTPMLDDLIIKVEGKGVVIAVPFVHPSGYPATEGACDGVSRQRGFFNTLISKAKETGGALPIVMMAHLAVDGCDTAGHDEMMYGGMPKDKITELGDGYDYLALGHIHHPQAVGARARYSGSILPVSFSEDYTHSVAVVEIESHGSVPQVREIELAMARRVLTIPPEGAPYEKALKLLAQVKADETAYIRLLIDQDLSLPADANSRALMAVDGKGCRFCGCFKKPRRACDLTDDGPEVRVGEVEDLAQLRPIDIALRSFRTTHGAEMPPELMKMMQQAIDATI